MIRGIYELVCPTAILQADHRGITVFLKDAKRVWNPEAQSWIEEPKSILVPYALIESIEEGRMSWTVKGGVSHDRRARALIIRCKPPLDLSHYGIGAGVAMGMGASFFVNAHYLECPLSVVREELNTLKQMAGAGKRHAEHTP
jgi:hypothetical protein